MEIHVVHILNSLISICERGKLEAIDQDICTGMSLMDETKLRSGLVFEFHLAELKVNLSMASW